MGHLLLRALSGGVPGMPCTIVSDQLPAAAGKLHIIPGTISIMKTSPHINVFPKSAASHQHATEENNTDLGSEMWVQILTLVLTNCVTWVSGLTPLISLAENLA